jgi:bacterioferritin
VGSGIHPKGVAEKFLERAADEQSHAEKIPERIIQLNGELNLIAEGTLTRGHPEYVEGDTPVDMIREDLIAERIGIESSSEIIR